MATLIQEDFWNAHQSWYFESITENGGVRLRVKIRRNAYDDQSSAVCERWDGDAWQQVISRPIEQMACSAVSYVTKNPDRALFEADAGDLRTRAMQVVS